MNFRQKFEAWHKSRFGYVAEPIRPFTAMNCKYSGEKQQLRWEGWQACHTNSFEEGREYERGLVSKGGKKNPDLWGIKDTRNGTILHATLSHWESASWTQLWTSRLMSGCADSNIPESELHKSPNFEAVRVRVVEDVR